MDDTFRAVPLCCLVVDKFRASVGPDDLDVYSCLSLESLDKVMESRECFALVDHRLCFPDFGSVRDKANPVLETIFGRSNRTFDVGVDVLTVD